jgi:hypothetical protein
MKQVCRKDPDLEEVTGSPTVEAAFERTAREVERAAPDLPSVIMEGHLRYLRHPALFPKLIATVLTLDRFTSSPQWDLSLSLPSMIERVEPSRVPDEYALVIAQTFLGEGYREIPPMGAFKAVRQFVKAAPEEG